MAILIGALLLFALTYWAFRGVSKSIGCDSFGNPVVRSGPDDIDVDDSAAGLDSIFAMEAEDRELESTRELLAGRIDPATYRDRMAEFAKASSAEAGGSP